MSARPHASAGFTLIEVLVAVVVLSIVGTLIAGGFTQTARNKRRIEEEADRYHSVRLVLERMVQELSMAFVSMHLNPDQGLQTVKTSFVGVDRVRGDRVDFTSFSHQRLYRDAHESDQNELSYFVTRHPEDRSRRVLARREQNRIDDEPRQGGDVEVLLEDVEDFQLEYLDPISGEWLDTWDTTQGVTGQPNRLPAQVRILLEVPDPHRPRRTKTFGTRVSIPITWALNHAVYNP